MPRQKRTSSNFKHACKATAIAPRDGLIFYLLNIIQKKFLLIHIPIV